MIKISDSGRKTLNSSRRRNHLARGWLVLELVVSVLLSLCVTCHSFSTNPQSYGDVVAADNNSSILESPEAIQEMIELILNNTRSNRNQEPDLTLITFLQNAVRSYGQKKVAKSIYELAQKDLYDLIWMLAGDLDTYLIFDLYNVYSAAQSDPQVLSVYQRFRAGSVNRTIVPEVFALDKKYDQYNWWQRVRGRMLNSVDRYMAGQLDINGGKTPPPIEYDKDGKVIIAGVRIPDSSTISTIRRAGFTTTKDPFHYELEKDSDEDIFEFLTLD